MLIQRGKALALAVAYRIFQIWFQTVTWPLRIASDHAFPYAKPVLEFLYDGWKFINENKTRGLFLILFIIISFVIALLVAMFLFLCVYFLFVPSSSQVGSIQQIEFYHSPEGKPIGNFRTDLQTMGGYEYTVKIFLRVPESPTNKNAGMVTLNLTLIDADDYRVLSSSLKSTSIQYKSDLLEWMWTYAFSLPLIFGFKYQEQVLVLDMPTFIAHRSGISIKGTVTLSEDFDIYPGSYISFMANLGFIGNFLHSWFYLFFFMFISIITVSSWSTLVFLGVVVVTTFLNPFQDPQPQSLSNNNNNNSNNNNNNNNSNSNSNSNSNNNSNQSSSSSSLLNNPSSSSLPSTSSSSSLTDLSSSQNTNIVETTSSPTIPSSSS